MFTLYLQSFGRKVLLLIALSMMNAPLFSQTTNSFEPGIVRLKFSEELISQLEKSSLRKTSTGEILTGISKLDQVNRIYHVLEFKRVFRPAGKNEARHRKHGLHRWYELKLKTSGRELEAVMSYRSLDHIEMAEPVYKKSLIGADGRKPVVVSIDEIKAKGVLNNASNDPMLPSQWHYNNTGQTGGTPGADIKLLQAWEKETGKPEVIVAVTDGGIQTNHPDLAANMWVNAGEIPGNHVDDDDNGYIDDVNGYSFVTNSGSITPDNHGTHVAGTIAAVTNNGIGVAGVAGGSGTGDGVRLMSCAVFGNFTSGGFAEAYVYASDNGALISQNSWGYWDPNVFEQNVLDAIDYFIAESGHDDNGQQTGLMNGGLVIFSAGNGASDEHFYPGYYPPVVSVASTNHNDKLSWYSNYGDWVDIAAPGGETHIAANQGVLSTLSNNSYGYFQGTSMACPHVSGVAALVLSKFGKQNFTPQTLRTRLLRTSTNIGIGGIGAGRVDAGVALQDTDTTPPEAVTDLAVLENSLGKITLQWTAPNDVGSFVASYDIRYSTAPITEVNFDQATSGGKPDAAAIAGDPETFTVNGLPGNTILYFALRAIDFSDNVSQLSNSVSVTTVLAPKIVVNVSSVNESLLTAQTSTKTFVISNTGEGTLSFTLPNAIIKNDFAVCAPSAGTIGPGDGMEITVAFDANTLTAGPHQKDLMITSNDPLANEIIVPLILNVTPNGFPILRTETTALNFKSVQIDSSSTRVVRLYNAGSEPLLITNITFDHNLFSSPVANASIPSFSEFMLPVIFAPNAEGIVSATASVETNDPEHIILNISLTGEGLADVPVTITPDSLHISLNKGSLKTETFTVTNHGSFDRNYSIHAVARSGPGGPDRPDPEPEEPEEEPEEAQLASKIYTSKTMTQARTSLLSKVNSGEVKIDPLLRSIQGQHTPTKKKSVPMPAGRTALASPASLPVSYKNGFEDFNLGPVTEQQGWTSFQGWDISEARPDKGSQHLRGSAVTPGVITYAISPFIFGNYYEDESIILPYYTTFSARVNLKDFQGAMWEVIPQDIDFVTTRIRIYPNGSIYVMSVDREYNILWNPINIETSSGYFTITVEHYMLGDESIGFPIFDVFINDQKVLSGLYSLGSIINCVALVCAAETEGGKMDIDEVLIREGKYIPPHIAAEISTGIIPAGTSTQVTINADAKNLHFGEYKSDIIVRIDETEEMLLPTTIDVVGPGSMSVEPKTLNLSSYPLWGNGEIVISNTGGQEFSYAIESHLTDLYMYNQTSTVAVEKRRWAYVEFTSPIPGLYFDTLKITTSLEAYPEFRIPLKATVWEENAQFYTASTALNFELPKGSRQSKNFPVQNIGSAPLAFRVIPEQKDLLSVQPASGVLNAQQILPLNMQLNASALTEGPGTTSFTIFTNDVDNPSITFQVNYVVVAENSGSILREVWTNVSGVKVSNIPLNRPPSSTSYLTKLEGPVNESNLYGARIRGFVKAPLDGLYTFWISSDDASELWLSTDMNPDKKVRIAYLDRYVTRAQYNKYPSQKSAPIQLRAGEKYYVEVLHKENKGFDHFSVGWDLPNGKKEFPIPAKRLYPPDAGPANMPPIVSIRIPIEGQYFIAPASIPIDVQAYDEDGEVTLVEFYNGTEKIGDDDSEPFTFDWNNVPTGNYELLARAMDNKGAFTSASVHVVVQNSLCESNGIIQREVWRNITGSKISSIPVNTAPTEVTNLVLFEAPSSDGDAYGARIRGYVCVPITGDYTFWIASDNNSELWLSTSDDPSLKVQIASVSGYTASRQWLKYPSQKSVPVHLEAGNKYYIEALHKEATSNDNLAVGWTLPNGIDERPIPGGRLIPFGGETQTANSRRADEGLMEKPSASVILSPNPTKGGKVNVMISGLSDTTSPMKIMIIETSGKIIHETESTMEAPGKATFITGDAMVPGIYLVKITLGKSSYSKRLIVH